MLAFGRGRKEEGEKTRDEEGLGGWGGGGGEVIVVLAKTRVTDRVPTISIGMICHSELTNRVSREYMFLCDMSPWRQIVPE